MSEKIDYVNLESFSQQVPDNDPTETREWIDSFDDLLAEHGPVRARYILTKLLERAHEVKVGFPVTVTSPYINTIAKSDEIPFPGDMEMERKIRSLIRWNAVAMVVRANAQSEGIGGHLATYASSASLYEVAFNHFFKGKDPIDDEPSSVDSAGPGQMGTTAKRNGEMIAATPGDLVFFQGHASPGIYARAFLEGRLEETDLDKFRFEASQDSPPTPNTGGYGLSSYPHPRLMPAFWEFPTVSMGLGPIMSIYLARFARYLENIGIASTGHKRIWGFLGDGEIDEPETLTALRLAAQERLDNLTFIVNCNLQRLDGPVRGNGKVIQELEATFRGAGWNVIKVIWGAGWDQLLARDSEGLLLGKMTTTVDGEYQKYATENGAYIREHFFGPDPRLQTMVEGMSDKELESLPRGGHDYAKLYNAYKAAVDHRGAPTVILAKTVKGWMLGSEIAARNSTHQIKKMNHEQLAALRDRLHLGDIVKDADLAAGLPPYARPDPGSEIANYLSKRRTKLGGSLPKRVDPSIPLGTPGDSVFAGYYEGSAKVAASTTMVFARMLRELLKDPSVGERVVPIVPDEARTFGMDAMFRESKIYSSTGQRYVPVDAGLLLSYVEAKDGRILEEGISEAGAMSSFIAAGTSHLNFGIPMLPFFTFYSMFGFQRIGDLIWAASDAGAKGFLMGATAGRTTLPGEGLQHADGHSHVLASVIPSVKAYDPAFAYEVAAIVKAGIEDMFVELTHNGLYYITLYNESYPMPGAAQAIEAIPGGGTKDDLDAAIVSGLYRFAGPAETTGDAGLEAGISQHHATILFSGSLWSVAMQARQELADKWGVATECWSATSYKTLREDALEVERWNMLNPASEPRVSRVTRCIAESKGPVVAVSDYIRAVPDQISRWVPRPYTSLGTDGFGRSDSRQALRKYFEVDAPSIVVAVLSLLHREGSISTGKLQDAISNYGMAKDSPGPWER